jgi:Protein of unknown function (DUF3617)
MQCHPAIGVIARAATLVLAGVLPAMADGLAAGEWRVLSRPEINGVAGPQSENTRCLTAADIADLDKTFSPVSRTTNSICEQVEHESTPQHLKWHLQCTGQLDMDVAGEFIFDTPEHYTGEITAHSSMLGRALQDVHTSIEGRRVGECK